MAISEYLVSQHTVIDTEINYVKRRRNMAFSALSPQTSAPAKHPVGLALSGGGMRSATFNLGVIQALAKYKLLPWIDYMTTVSGGGYTGACFSSLMATKKVGLKDTSIYKYPMKSTDAGMAISDATLEDASNKTVDVLGLWFNVRTVGTDGWLYGNPEIFDPDRGVLQPTFLWLEPSFTAKILRMVKPNDEIIVNSGWYQVQHLATFKTGWVNANSIAATSITFSYSTKTTNATSSPRFPFDPDTRILSTGDTPDKPPNQLLSHIRAHGNFIIPKVRFFATDVRRAIGTLLTNLSHTIWLFVLIMVVAASLHFVLSNLLVSSQPTFVVFNESEFQNEIQPDPKMISWDHITSTVNSDRESAVSNLWLPSLLFSSPRIDVMEKTSPHKPLNFQLPGEFLLAALAGVFTSIISTLYLYRYYRLKLSDESPDMAKLLSTLDKRLWVFQLVGIIAVIVTVRFLPLPDGITLYRLWLPTAFMVGSWLTVTLSYPLFFRNRGWQATWRSLLGIHQGTNTYLFIFAVLFGVMALPYFIKIGNISNPVSIQRGSLIWWAITALVSLLLSQGMLKVHSSEPSFLHKLPFETFTVLKVAVNLFVGLFIISVIALIGNAFNDIGSVDTSQSTYLIISLILFALALGLLLLWTLLQLPFRKKPAPRMLLQFILALALSGAMSGILWLAQGGLAVWVSNPLLWSVLGIGLFALGMFLLLSSYVNFNRISLHYFYRDRLAETFLRTEVTSPETKEPGVVREQNDLRLQDINPYGSIAPYHLLLTTLNLPNSQKLSYRDLRADHFIFSKYFCGSPETGYYPTHLYRGGLTKLARAMAISGAAVSSTLGYNTFFGQAFLMTLFNLRLAYWMDNPHRYSTDIILNAGWWSRLIKGDRAPALATFETGVFWPQYVLREMFGKADATSKLVNLSDGGHLDNTGVFPLLQRRCRIIIAGDAGADPDYTCNEIARVVRRAYAEENIRIEIDLDPVRADPETGLSQSHCVVGKIIYPEPDAPDGWLIYLKPTITGNERDSIKAYWLKHRHDHFPQQTTGDQFYDDSQFDVYRQLGEMTVEHTLSALKTHYRQVHAEHLKKLAELPRDTYDSLIRDWDDDKISSLEPHVLRTLYSEFLGYKTGDEWEDFFDERKRSRDALEAQMQATVANDLAVQLKNFKYELMTAIEALSFWDNHADQENTIIHKILNSHLDAFQSASDTSASLTDYERIIDRVATHFIPGLQTATNVSQPQGN